MPNHKQYGANRQIRFTDELWDRIEEYRLYVKNKTGVDITSSQAIRALIDSALSGKGITNESQSAKKDSK